MSDVVVGRKSNRKSKVVFLTEVALLSAIIVLMAFTPLGYLRIGVEEITFIVVPVAVGSVVLGPWAGLFLGLVFGISSLLQPTSLAIISLVPWQAVVTCIVPRLFVGFLPGLIYQGLNKATKKRGISTAIACISAPIINTILYLTFFVLFLGQFMADLNPDAFGFMAGKNFFAAFGLFLAAVSINAVLEAASCLIIATAICNALYHTVNRNR